MFVITKRLNKPILIGVLKLQHVLLQETFREQLSRAAFCSRMPDNEETSKFKRQK